MTTDSLHSQGKSCYVTGRVADLLYHLAMTAGNHVLVTRVQSIVPINWRKRALIFHTSLTALRLIIGIVDVALIHISNYPDGTCKYTDEEFVSDLNVDMPRLIQLTLWFIVGPCIHLVRYANRSICHHYDLCHLN